MKKLTIVFLMLGLLLGLVVFKIIDWNGYKSNPDSLLARLQQDDYSITPEKADRSFLVITLGNSDFPEGLAANNRLNLSLSELQKKENIELLLKPGQKVALVSADIATSVKAFTFLHQQGLENLFIIDAEGDSGEVLKYKFVPEASLNVSVGDEEKLE
jgi:hypothetical protein